ncbi:MAG: glycosyl transferase family 9 [Rhodocyclales bacterium]|nr:glycosyl transferase family 9 [Rhodocyclales bacterium]
MHSNVINLTPCLKLRHVKQRKAASLWQLPPQRIAVFRALQLGDMLCTIPALRALRSAAPQAHIALIGLPSARVICERFAHYIDELILFPGVPEFPEQAADVQALPGFIDAMRARNFDVAIQLHGSGQIANDLVRQFGAKLNAGFVPDMLSTAADENADARYFMPWPDHLPEIHRYLALMRFLGVENVDDHLELPLYAADWAEWEDLTVSHSLRQGEYVCVHVGARMPSRRWPIDRFAEVAAHFIAHGAPIVLTGAAEERSLVDSLKRLLEARMPGPEAAAAAHIVDLCGHTSLGGLAALVARSRVLICNDTGVSHIAAAVGARSVVIASGSDAARWAPLDRERHRVLAHHVPCRPCMHHECPIDHPCARGISPEMVIQQAQYLTGEAHAA